MREVSLSSQFPKNENKQIKSTMAFSSHSMIIINLLQFDCSIFNQIIEPKCIISLYTFGYIDRERERGGFTGNIKCHCYGAGGWW